MRSINQPPLVVEEHPGILEATLDVCVALTDQSQTKNDALANIHLTLMHAATSGRIPLVSHLLRSGVPVDFAPRGLTALYAALSSGKMEMIDFLIAEGASLENDRFGPAARYARSIGLPEVAEHIEALTPSSTIPGVAMRRLGRRD